MCDRCGKSAAFAVDGRNEGMSPFSSFFCRSPLTVRTARDSIATMRTLLCGFAALLLVGCSTDTSGSSQPSSSAGVSSAITASAGSTSSRKPFKLHWIFQKTRTGDNGEPYASVSLTLSGSTIKTVSLGEFVGTCSQQTKEQIVALAKGTITAARCWWAGGGDEWRARKDAAKKIIVIEHRTVDEGTAEAPAPEQPWVQVGDAIAL